MGVLRFATAISLSAGLAFSAGSALANRLDQAFIGTDDKCDSQSSDIEVIGGMYFLGRSFLTWTQANGIGTGGDQIWLWVGSDLPNKVSANDKSGSVSQKNWSEICVRIISADVNRDRPEACMNVEKCSVKGKTTVNSDNETIKLNTSTKCSGDGSDVYGRLSADQIQSIEAAFPKGNKCGVKVDIEVDPEYPGKKSSLSIKMNTNDASVDVIEQ